MQQVDRRTDALCPRDSYVSPHLRRLRSYDEVVRDKDQRSRPECRPSAAGPGIDGPAGEAANDA